MGQKVEENLKQVDEKVSTNLEIGVYTIYDCVLKQFGARKMRCEPIIIYLIGHKKKQKRPWINQAGI